MLLDANDLLVSIKKAAQEAAEAGQPADFCFGKVTSAKPLKILVEQKMTLGEAQLVLTRNVTDYKTKITGGNVQNYYYTGDIESGTAPVSPSHVHAVGKITVTIHNALTVGEEVVLMKQKGGQKYLVLDRVVKT
ncbi:DUF2577 domain-containing protein [Longicatena sp. 210702-DFI.1.194]|uniref:DUF2577 domain-containing protein n=1 Tax=Ihubacter sp. rT4E-8 TaxID=3242369 RepID=UPI003CEE9353|nr:DUF2577 domain-containing protein [Longicatena sp. 210702-DFI.1.194]